MMSIAYKQNEKGVRPWGTWEVLAILEKGIVKRISVLPHSSLSLQLHHHRQEHWYITLGTAQVTLGEEKRILSFGESIDIPKETKHRIENLTDNPVEFIEIQTGEILDENDIVRFEDIYNRV